MWYEYKDRLLNLSKAQRIYYNNGCEITVAYGERKEFLKFEDDGDAIEAYQTIRHKVLGISTYAHRGPR